MRPARCAAATIKGFGHEAALGESKMYEVAVSLLGLALLVAVLICDCCVRAKGTNSAETSHFSVRLLQQARAVLRHYLSLSSIRRPGAVGLPRR
jgi:hypothetical protein